MSENAYENLKGEPLALIALAGGKSYRKAAELAGVHLRTIGRRMEDPAYRRRVQDMRSEMLEQASGMLAQSATMAVARLMSLLKAESEQVQLGAARAILDSASRYRELVEISERVAAIEETLAVNEQGLRAVK